MPGNIDQINGRNIEAVFATSALSATTASYALTAETLLGSVATASYALTASVLLGSVATASYALTASTSNTAAFAVSASAVKISNNTTTNATYYPTFVSQTSGNTELQVDSSTLTWNPSTNTLTATNFAGNATTATNATNATTASYAFNSSASSITNDTSTNFNYFVTFAEGTSGNQPLRVDSNTLTFNPSTNTLTAANFAGNATTATNATSATSASYALTATSASFLNTLSQSLTITGSVNGNVISASIVSSTASLNLSAGNFFFIQLQNSSTTHINPTNIRPGQTVNIRIQQAGGSPGSVSWPPTVRQPSGSFYTASLTAGAYDIVSLISFDTSNLYLSYVKRLI